jgi:hypothetical protein
LRGSVQMADVVIGEFRLVRAERSENAGWADRFHFAMRKKKGEKRGWNGIHGFLELMVESGGGLA